ncbi:helix-turn-helix transcriptional regulator [bacterium]|nr:helix-turn-helix transcriptional regulator [bacterium]
MEQINLIDVTLLLAAAQGMFLTIYLLHRHRRPLPNRFLIVLNFSYSVILIEMMLEELNFWDPFPWLIPVVLGIVFVMVPAHYYYALHLTRPGRKLQWRDLLHLLPFVLLELFQGVGMLRGQDPTEELFVPSHGGITVFNLILMGYALVYMILTLVRLERHRAASLAFLSNIERIQFRWLNNLTWLTIIILISFSLENLLLLRGIQLSDEFNLTSLLVALFVYALGYQILLHPDILVVPRAETLGANEQAISAEGPIDVLREDAPKYQKSGLSDERADAIRTALLQVMEQDEAFRNPDLTLIDLADRLEVSPHNLSEVINTRLGVHFFDYVNRYRIEQVKRDILDPGKQHLKMLAIAFEAGFRSKSSFNLLFKKHVGMTPSEYRKQNS